jgi:hypothetical protein
MTVAVRVAAATPPSHLGLLLGLDGRRAAAAARRPRPGVWASVLLPLALVGGALWSAGAEAVPDARVPSGAVALGFMVAAPIAWLAYGVLFRPADDAFLRRLGLEPTALYAERALRLAAAAAGVAAVLLVPFLASGAPLARPAATLAASAAAAWGAALLSLAAAARSTSRPGGGRGVIAKSMGPDAELGRVGALVWAPLGPLAAALAAAGWVGAAAGAGWGRAGVAAVAGVVAAVAGGRPFAQALPRFAPRALEMSFEPPPAAGETGLVLDRGLARLLPRPARAVWARDSTITARRFRWATSIVWPVAILSTIALARWGAMAEVRAWVLAAGALTLVAQGAAVIAMGRLERAGPRWLDHSAGLRVLDRWLGRAAFGFGLSLWLAVPLGLAWGLWAGAGPGWAWAAAGAVSAAVAASASLAAAGR